MKYVFQKNDFLGNKEDHYISLFKESSEHTYDYCSEVIINFNSITDIEAMHHADPLNDLLAVFFSDEKDREEVYEAYLFYKNNIKGKDEPSVIKYTNSRSEEFYAYNNGTTFYSGDLSVDNNTQHENLEQRIGNIEKNISKMQKTLTILADKFIDDGR